MILKTSVRFIPCFLCFILAYTTQEVKELGISWEFQDAEAPQWLCLLNCSGMERALTNLSFMTSGMG